ncbi:MAG: SlyX family protein [Pirellulales bacterium]
MTDERAHEPNAWQERMVELETMFTHLQHTVSELDRVVLSQQRQIDALERTIAGLRHELGALAGAFQEPRKPEDEKPPHY